MIMVKEDERLGFGLLSIVQGAFTGVAEHGGVAGSEGAKVKLAGSKHGLALIYRFMAAAVWMFADMAIRERRPSRPNPALVMRLFREQVLTDTVQLVGLPGDDDGAAKLWNDLVDDVEMFATLAAQLTADPSRAYLMPLRLCREWIMNRTSDPTTIAFFTGSDSILLSGVAFEARASVNELLSKWR